MSKKPQKMSLNAFNESFGETNWAVETDQFSPNIIPLSQRLPDHLTLHMVPIDHCHENDLRTAFRGIKNIRIIKHFAYVEFANEGDCLAALQKDGTKILGQLVKIAPAKEGIKDNSDQRNWGRNQWNQSGTQMQPRRPPTQEQSWDRSNWGQGKSPTTQQTDSRSNWGQNRSPTVQTDARPNSFGNNFGAQRPHHESNDQHQHNSPTNRNGPRPDFRSKADSVSSWRK